MRILVTGGAGFIGSALIRHLIRHTGHEVLNLDKLTYAGNLESLSSIATDSRYEFVQADIVDQATRRALAIRDETERRRHAYLQRVEQDRERAVSQITYLYDQRQDAIAELARLQTTVQAIVEEMARSPLGRPAPGVAIAAASPAMTDGSPTLPPEDDMRLRPDRALDRLVAPASAGALDQPAGASRTGERAGRHGMSSDSELSPEYDRHSLTGVGDLRARAEMHQTAEQLAPQTRRSESLFDADVPAEEVPEATRSSRRRTGLFDAEKEGWT